MMTTDEAMAEAERRGLRVWQITYRGEDSKIWSANIRTKTMTEDGRAVVYFGIAYGVTAREAVIKSLDCTLVHWTDSAKAIEAASLKRKRAEDWA